VLGCSVRQRQVRDVTSENFQAEVLGAATPVVVEYWAHGCLPCMQLSRHLERTAVHFEGRVAFRKFNLGWSAANVQRYHVKSVPTLVFYRQGREIARQVGLPDDDVDETLVAFVEQSLATP
jgi:thioredoxin 1